jgi:hypothetical protein
MNPDLHAMARLDPDQIEALGRALAAERVDEQQRILKILETSWHALGMTGEQRRRLRELIIGRDI